MSLKVWLPLNGDLKNNGLSNVTVTNNGATVDNNGKIGKCYSFDGTDDYMFVSPSFLSNSSTEWSYCCWMKLRSKQYGCLFCDRTTTSASGLAIFYYGSQWLVDDGTRWQFNARITLNVDTWYHVAVVVKKGVGKYLYVNGKLDSSTTATGTPTIINTARFSIGASMNSATTVNANYFSGYLNDVRIYDHALSVNEVKEISKGLICHYKLDGFNSGVNSNMLLNTPKSYTPTSYLGYQLNFTENLIANETYTLQLWDVEVSHSAKTGSALGIWVYWGGGSTGLFSFTSANSELVNGKADYLVKTFTITSGQASGSGANNAWFNMYNSVGYVAGTLNMKIGKWKLEKGSIATPYCRTASEMGIDTTKIIDSSGYNYHGEIWRYNSLGNIEVYSNTPRNSLSTYVNSENNTTNTASGTIYIYGHCELTSPKNLTVSFWCKPIAGYNNTVDQGQFCLTNISMGSNAGSDYTTSAMNHRDSIIDFSNGTTTYHKTIPIPFTANEWHHYAISYDGRYMKVFKDGVQTATSDMGSEQTLCSIKGAILGFSKAGGVWRSNKSYYSDFRLYTTTLSADDILELYQVGAKIDKSGNMYGYELKED